MSMVPMCLLLSLLATSAGSSRSFVDPALVGRWRGSARIVVQWVEGKELPLDLTIDGDGTVRGTVGDAKLVSAHLKRNRGAIGRALGLASDWIVKGDLEGPLVAAEGITRKSVSIPFDLVGGRLAGGVNSSGPKVGDRGHVVIAAAQMKLERVKP
jgi:hypothetical protein